MAQPPGPTKTVGAAESVTIAPRRFGTLRGRITIIDPDWWKPMSEGEVAAFLEGRY